VNTANSHTFQQQIEEHLRGQGLGDQSQDIAEVLWQHVLSWRVDSEALPKDAKHIFAFAFGFRWNASQYGTRQPGPVNEELAYQVRQYYKARRRHVYAQWEISSLLVDYIRGEHLHPIFPEIDESGREQYLSTKGVLDKIVNLLKRESPPKEPKAMGPVLIVAHGNHLPSTQST